MKPNSSQHDPSPVYLRSLVAHSGLSQRGCARRLGISERAMRYYLADPGLKPYLVAPYLVQFALESLALWPEDPTTVPYRIEAFDQGSMMEAMSLPSWPQHLKGARASLAAAIKASTP